MMPLLVSGAVGPTGVMLSLCEEPSTPERIRGNHENKIRFFCNPEKIFETFASEKDGNGELFMSYHDFFRTLTPYNYQKAKEAVENEPGYFETHKPEVLKIADVNQDGKIDFPEFLFFITVL